MWDHTCQNILIQYSVGNARMTPWQSKHLMGCTEDDYRSHCLPGAYFHSCCLFEGFSGANHTLHLSHSIMAWPSS